jgi:hypothetical protein
VTDPIAQALDKFVPAFPSADGDWQAILSAAAAPAPGGTSPAKRSVRRSGLRRVPARVALVAAVLVLAFVVTAVAFGWPQRIVDFFSSPPAPKGVQNGFARDNVGSPPGMDPRAIPGETKKITTLRLTVRGGRTRLYTLYVAPTKSGGFCELWTGVSGGCVSVKTLRRPEPLGVGYGGMRAFGNVNSAYPNEVDGFVRRGATRTLEALFADGTTATILPTWVSAPINAGFFLYPVPHSHQNRAHALRSVVALDADGRVIGRYTIPIDDFVAQTLPDGTKVSLAPEWEAAKARKIINFRATDRSQVSVWMMPRRGGGSCVLGPQGGGWCSPPWSAKQGQGFNGGFQGGAHRLLFFGGATPGVATVVFHYQNGTSERVTPVDGVVVLEITPAHWNRGTRLVAAVALNRNGKTISTQHFQLPPPLGLYPCKRPINRGHGEQECP